MSEAEKAFEKWMGPATAIDSHKYERAIWLAAWAAAKASETPSEEREDVKPWLSTYEW